MLLASAINGRVKYVGRISADGIPPETRETLMERLPTLVRKKPFVKCPAAGVWLKPVLMCRVAYKKMTKSNKLRDAEFRAMLRDVR